MLSKTPDNVMFVVSLHSHLVHPQVEMYGLVPGSEHVGHSVALPPVSSCCTLNGIEFSASLQQQHPA